MDCPQDGPLQRDNFDPDLALDFLKNIRNKSNSQEFTDVSIEVEGEIFNCHKFILSACSGFFDGLFSSNMKENLNNHISLKECSSKTFKLILTSLYENKSVISNDNLFDLWKSSNMLQILAIVKKCEEFAKNNLDKENAVEILHTADLLSSQASVKDASWNYILEHFDEMVKPKGSGLLRLSFLQLKELIKDNNLKTQSEDNVVMLICYWISSNENDYDISDYSKKEVVEKEKEGIIKTHTKEFQSSPQEPTAVKIKSQSDQNESNQTTVENDESREDMLMELLTSCRLILASNRCLDQLRDRSYLVRTCPKVKKLLRNCIAWKRDGSQMYNASLEMGRHRNFSDYQDCVLGIVSGQGKDMLRCLGNFSPVSCDFLPVSCNFLPVCSNSDLNPDGYKNVLTATVWNNCVFFITDAFDLYSYSLFVKKGHKMVYEKIVDCNDISIIADTVGLYLLDPSVNKSSIVYTEVVTVRIIAARSFLESICNISISFMHSMLLIFGNRPDEKETTVMQCMDISGNNIYCMNEFKGEKENMVIFKTLYCTFCLFGSGHLWKIEEIEDSGLLGSSYVSQIWKPNKNINLNGAVITGDTLMVTYHTVDNRNMSLNVLQKIVPEVFNQICPYWVAKKYLPCFIFTVNMLK